MNRREKSHQPHRCSSWGCLDVLQTMPASELGKLSATSEQVGDALRLGAPAAYLLATAWRPPTENWRGATHSICIFHDSEECLWVFGGAEFLRQTARYGDPVERQEGNLVDVLAPAAKDVTRGYVRFRSRGSEWPSQNAWISCLKRWRRRCKWRRGRFALETVVTWGICRAERNVRRTLQRRRVAFVKLNWVSQRDKLRPAKIHPPYLAPKLHLCHRNGSVFVDGILSDLLLDT